MSETLGSHLALGLALVLRDRERVHSDGFGPSGSGAVQNSDGFGLVRIGSVAWILDIGSESGETEGSHWVPHA